jgi:Fungal Zn(2)-Cys(6) binuclear cluster domain
MPCAEAESSNWLLGLQVGLLVKRAGFYSNYLVRARRVKCDENKPECNRCKRLVISCRYTAISESNANFPAFIPIKPRLSCVAITQNPSSSIPGDDYEKRYFQLFREKLSYDLCGYFETSFW